MSGNGFRCTGLCQHVMSVCYSGPAARNAVCSIRGCCIAAYGCVQGTGPCQHGMGFSDWFICNFLVFGGGFREVFWSVLTCFSDSFPSIFRSKFPPKIAKNQIFYKSVSRRLEVSPGKIFACRIRICGQK